MPSLTATQLAQIRAYHGLSLSETARWLAVNERTYRRWESGDTIPPGVVEEMTNLEELRVQLDMHITQGLPIEEFPRLENTPIGLITVVQGELLSFHLWEETQT